MGASALLYPFLGGAKAAGGAYAAGEMAGTVLGLALLVVGGVYFWFGLQEIRADRDDDAGLLPHRRKKKVRVKKKKPRAE